MTRAVPGAPSRRGTPAPWRLPWLAAALALLLAVTACSGSGSTGAASGGKPAELRVGYQLIPNGDLVVKHHRWLEDRLGIPVRWIRFDSGAAVNQAVADHTIDVGLAGTSSIANGVLAGLDYRVAWIFDIIGSAEALVVRRDGGVTDLAGLRGKRVAVPFGSTTHYALLAALTRAHVDPATVTILDLQPRQIVAAWQGHAIDAAYIWQPSLATILGENGRVLLDSAQLGAQGVITGDLGIASTELVDGFPDVVSAWVEQENKAVQQITADPATAAKAIAAELSITPAQAQEAMKGYKYLSAKDQLGAGYLGTPNAPGRLVSQLTSTAVFLSNYPETAKFLKEPKLYQPKVTEAVFRPVVDPTFVAKVAR